MKTGPFGKYELLATLGRGGMADVFLAVARGPEGFQKLVVVKRLREDVADDEAFRSMLLDEARLAARLHHPNVVQTLEVGRVDGAWFLAMEYLDGQSLHKAVRRAIVDPPAAVAVVRDLLNGLDYAHDLRDYDGTPLDIVHRDVSPQNVFLTYTGEVKLVDFGIAKASVTTMGTAVGVLKGKLAYMAPEQVDGRLVDRRADVFATGIVLWECLARTRIYRVESSAEMIRRLLSWEAPPLAEIVPDIDPALAAIVARALARDPAARFENAREMRDALDAFVDRAGWRIPRREEIGRRMGEAFATERDQIRTIIGDHMAATSPSGSMQEASMTTDALPVVRGSSSPELRSLVTTQAMADTPPAPPSTPRRRAGRGSFVAGVALVALATVGGGALLFTKTRSTAAARDAASSGAPRDSAGDARVVLRLQGSNTIGAELAPALAEAFFRRRGAADISRRPGARSRSIDVVARMGGDSVLRVIEISAEGTATAFEGLLGGACDIGMASRPISADEAKKLAESGLGDMRAPASEHVVALDGIAVVVHPNNPARALTITQLASIFDGEAADWSMVGGRPGAIHLYARDDQSGTFDTFRHLVLGRHSLAPTARRFASSEALSDTVASDAGGIGFIGLAYVRSAKPVAVGEGGVAPMFPSSFTVTTEDYRLSRRLYFYTSSQPRPEILDFVGYALSSDGQEVVRSAGFVDLDVTAHDPEPCGGRCPARYAARVAGARRLSLDFRFRSGTTELDSRGARDLDRLLAYLRGAPSAGVMLFGFTDAVGDVATNQKISLERARTVQAELGARGVSARVVDGFGADMPIAPNADDAGRERNRRVEVWVGAR